ncbi:MAG: hypothetical protein K5945_02980 [Bacteroidaceae bacterium]|nr:hypothetical protein [Bacteroidaceae bacterium]
MFHRMKLSVFYLPNEPKNLPNEPNKLPNGPCNLPKHVKNALFDYKHATLRQQAGASATASRGFRDSKQEALRQQAGDIAAAHFFAFCILQIENLAR